MATTTGKMEPTRELTGRSHSLRASKKNRAALAEAYAEAEQAGKAKEAFYLAPRYRATNAPVMHDPQTTSTAPACAAPSAV